MKIFISWSKPISNKIAICLQDFIKEIFDDHTIQFFISSEDIYAGDKWFQIISDGLRASQLAIICLTNENRLSKWLDFESGAVAFNEQEATICPFLFDIDRLEEGNPLNNFQITKNNKKDLLKLIKTIGRKANTTLTDKQIDNGFAGCYNNFERKLKEIKRNIPVKIESTQIDKYIYPTHVTGTDKDKLFLGTPMASIEGDQYKQNRDEIIEIIDEIKKHCKINTIYSPIIKNQEPKAFDGREKAMETDFTELKKSEYYVFIYPEKVASSILVEIGYAIALLKKTIIFVKKRSDLPFMLEKADNRNKRIRIYEYSSFAELKNLIRDEGEVMFLFND